MSRKLFGGIESNRVEYNDTCKKCKSEDVTISNEYDLKELSTVCPKCEDCGYSWFAKV